MRSFNEYADNAARFASPYIRKTSEFFGNASDEAQRWYYAEKKKRQKRKDVYKRQPRYCSMSRIIPK